MALEEMLVALEQEGQETVDRIESQAKAHENQILKEAKEEADRIRSDHIKKMEDQVRMERSRIINGAHFQVKKEVIRMKEAMMNEVFSEVSKRIENLRNDASYKDIFEKLTTEAVSGIAGKALVSIDPADENLGREVLDKMKIDYELALSNKCLGGLIARSEDGRIILNNTIDSRLDKAKQLLKTDVLKVLFGDS